VKGTPVTRKDDFRLHGAKSPEGMTTGTTSMASLRDIAGMEPAQETRR